MITREEIIKYAEQRGYDVTARKFRYWTNKRLLPKPEIKNLGDKGKEAWYPDDTKELVIAISHGILETRNLDNVRWQLWEKGYRIEIRDLLDSALKEYKQFVDNIQNDDFFYDNFVNQYSDHLPKGTFTSQVSKKLSDSYFSSFAYLIGLVFREPETEYDIDEDSRKDRDLDNRIFGIAIQAVIPGFEDIDVYKLLRVFRPYLEPENIEEVLSNSDNEMLKRAYQEISILINSNFIFSKGFFEGKLPKRFIQVRMTQFSNMDKSLLLLGWLSISRNPKLINGFNEIIATLKTMFPTMDNYGDGN